MAWSPYSLRILRLYRVQVKDRSSSLSCPASRIIRML